MLTCTDPRIAGPRRPRKASVLVSAFLLSFSFPGLAQSPAPQRALQTIEQVIRGGNEKARQAVPVQLNAEVTYIDSEWGMMFIRDSTGSLFVNVGKAGAQLKAGDKISISGVTEPGAVAPIIIKPHVTFHAHGVLRSSELIDLPSLQSGFADSEYIKTTGILRPGAFAWNHTSLVLVDGTTDVPLLIPGGISTTIQRLIGAKVTLVGVNAVRLDDAKRRLGSQLYVNSVADIQPEDPHWKPIADSPPLQIAKLKTFDFNRRFLPSVHVHGQVVWKGPGEIMLLDPSAGILVHFTTDSNVNPGAIVDVVGFPLDRADSLLLEDAQIFPTGRTAPQQTTPRMRTADEVLQSGRDGDLVRLQGRVISQEAKASEYLVTVNNAGVVYSIRIASAKETNQLVTLSPGATIQCTGALRIIDSANGRPKSFEVLADSPSEIVIQTDRRISTKLLLSIAIPVAIAVILLWIIQLKRALRSKTRQIREQLEHEVQLEDRYRRLFERNLAGVFSWISTGEIIDCNLAFAHFLGFATPADVIGKSYFSFCADQQPLKMPLLSAGSESGRETSLRKADGAVIHLLENTTCIVSGDAVVYETTALDITQARESRAELQRAKDALQWQAETDALTHLPNRWLFSQRLEAAVAKAIEQHAPVSLLYLDLDGFKTVNDNYGHFLGDMLLKATGERLLSYMGDGNSLYRLSGDEFAILLTNPQDAAKPQGVANCILEGLQAEFDLNGTPVSTCASIGLSTIPGSATDAKTLLQQADAALHVAKHSGKNVAIEYSEEIGTSHRERSQIAAELKRAIDRDEIILYYQPEFDTRTGELVRFEALARWTNHTLGTVPPNKFIPIAEECGLIRELGPHLMEMACRDAVRWQKDLGRDTVVAVNVSNLQLRSDTFISDVLDILRRTGLRPDLLELEMTESIMIDNPERMQRRLNDLRAVGVSLALDDFGTGYSCLSYLRELPFDRLKVDRSFLKQADLDRGTAALINAVVSVAHSLEMTVVVEGIETARELEFVKRLGADEVQGYHLGRPTPDPEAMLRAHTSAKASPSTPTAPVRMLVQQARQA